MGGVPPLSDELARQAADAYLANDKIKAAAAQSLGWPISTFKVRLKIASERGFLGTKPVLPEFRITKSSSTINEHGDIVREFITQKPDIGGEFSVPDGHRIKGISTLLDADGREVIKWVKTSESAASQEAGMRSVFDALIEELPRAEPVMAPEQCNSDLLNQYTITDMHLGMLAWGEETGADYDLKIAEKLLLDWFSAAIKMAPDAEIAVLAQLGDLLHHDAKVSVTPASGHVLDADSRLQKMIRVAIRVMRQIVRMLLEKHSRVHIIMADANHDEAGGAWLREMFAAFFEDDPRVTVDTSPNTYYAVEHGLTSLFYHHGHRKKIKQVDTVFAGKFREIYGRTKFAYGHMGHLHSDELISTNLMKVERHETLAAPDAYSANGGWLSGRSAKVITYSKRFGEVGRITLTPEMVSQEKIEQ